VGNAVPGSHSVVVVGSQTISLNGPAVAVESHGVMSFAPSGLIIVHSDTTSTYAVPAAAPVLYSGQTLTLGQPAVTIPGEGVVSLSPSGIVIINNGITTTKPLSNFPPTPTIPHSTLTAVFKDHTLTLSAPATFVPGLGTISLSPSGVIIINNGITIISTVLGYPPSPTLAYPLPQITVTVVGETHILFVISPSKCVIDDQTLTHSGLLATIAGHQVAKMKDEGVEIQIPGGVVTTILLNTTPGLAVVAAETGITPSGAGTSTASVMPVPGNGTSSSSSPLSSIYITVTAGKSPTTVTVPEESSSANGLGALIYKMQNSARSSRDHGVWSRIFMGLCVGFGWLMIS
jgi:hypothetical protein